MAEETKPTLADELRKEQQALTRRFLYHIRNRPLSLEEAIELSKRIADA
jgi:hypothetical protein